MVVLTEGEIANNWKRYIQALSSVDRRGIRELIEFLEEGEFPTEPASAKYHLNTRGGLCLHKLNVLYAARFFFGTSVLPEIRSVPDESIIVAALCHDLCKHKRYVENKDGTYSYAESGSFCLGHGEASLYVARTYIPLTDSEAMMIRWHMGPYDNGDYMKNQRYIEKYPEVLLFHIADNYASHYLDTLEEGLPHRFLLPGVDI